MINYIRYFENVLSRIITFIENKSRKHHLIYECHQSRFDLGGGGGGEQIFSKSVTMHSGRLGVW